MKWIDISTEQLEAAAENDRRGDPVDVVVAVDCNSFAAADGCQQAVDGWPHVRQTERVQQVIERRLQESAGRLRRVEASQAQQAGGDWFDAQCAPQRVGGRARRRVVGSR